MVLFDSFKNQGGESQDTLSEERKRRVVSETRDDKICVRWGDVSADSF